MATDATVNTADLHALPVKVEVIALICKAAKIVLHKAEVIGVMTVTTLMYLIWMNFHST
jgi:hypothetical protein